MYLHILVKCNVINLIIQELMKQTRKDEQFYMELRKTFTDKNYTQRAEWEVILDRRHYLTRN